MTGSRLDFLDNGCFFAGFDPDHACEGPMQRCHILRKQWLRDEVKLDWAERWHPDFWVWGCERHHDRFDRKFFHVTREQLPPGIERKADQYPKVAARLTRDHGARPPLIEQVAA